MTASKHDTAPAWVDPDDAPELDDEWFERADIHENGRLVQRGRPPVAHPKQRVTLRLDEDIASALRASGRGWQTRVNQALREWIEKGAG
ncbi:hypothetical protein GCM10011390_18640 [Aureimonas endophytica]|uniref:BrnA antitoxin of type II toxin-antitoxin system n=1 Tax=Aureimonas endophytica TaxID=2027858 RepID=A0A916ZIW1_9HYPH|nr:BrnA antitoxin family protein [Aureimonas endophytica]GGE00103.1 hypothetical protein GCM10011390_18640 [Aureimonas endophytica]